MKSTIVTGAIAVGFMLVLLSGLWSTLFPATSSWTPDKEERWSEVKTRLHNLSFVVGSQHPVKMHGGPDPGQAKQEFDQLKLENDELQTEFQSAADRPHTVSSFLRWTGIALAGIGIVGWYAVRES